MDLVDKDNQKLSREEIDKMREEVTNFENLFMNGGSGEDNRDLVDKDNQKLSREEIDKMREDGVDGVEIMEKLIENSETFQAKTKFSQEKFLKKKAKKYHQYILIRKPSIRLLMEITYKAGQPQPNCLSAMDYPQKVMDCLDVINIQ